MTEKKTALSLTEKLLFETSLRIMFDKGFESADIEGVSREAGVDIKKTKIFYASDDELRMAAMKYAAIIWTGQVKADILKYETNREKLHGLITHYIAGTESHPNSLSLYIDVWKRIKDLPRGNDRLKNGLYEIYQYYADFFIKVLHELYGDLQGIDAELMAWILVVISDGFHIQSLLLPEKFDYDGITRIFCKVLEPLKEIEAR